MGRKDLMAGFGASGDVDRADADGGPHGMVDIRQERASIRVAGCDARPVPVALGERNGLRGGGHGGRHAARPVDPVDRLARRDSRAVCGCGLDRRSVDRNAVSSQDWRIALAGSLVACLLFGGLLWHLYRFDGWEYVEQPFAPSGVEEIGLLVAAVLWLGGAALRAGELDRCGLAGAGAYVPLPESVRSKPALELPATKEAAPPLRPYRFSWIALLAEDWRRNGWLYPVAAAIVTAFFGVIVVGASLDEYRRSGSIMELPDIPSGAAGFGVGFLFVGAFLQVAASAHGRQTLRHGTQPMWALTLPVADRHLAAVAVLRQLLSNASAMLACWVVAIALWGVLYLLLLAVGQGPRASELVEHLRRMGRGDPSHGLFLTLVAAWVATGVSEASLQCGRRWCVAIPHMILIGTWFIAVACAIAFRGGELFVRLCLCVGMLASIFSTLVAVRAKVIPWTWGVAAVVLWGLTWTAHKYLSAFQHSPSHAWLEWQFFFALSLVMLPISLPPLAVAWNRRR